MDFGELPRLTRRVELRRVFAALDLNHDGFVTAPELQSAVEARPDLARFFGGSERLFERIDADGDGRVTWGEFTAYLREAEQGCSSHRKRAPAAPAHLPTVVAVDVIIERSVVPGEPAQLSVELFDYTQSTRSTPVPRNGDRVLLRPRDRADVAAAAFVEKHGLAPEQAADLEQVFFEAVEQAVRKELAATRAELEFARATLADAPALVLALEAAQIEAARAAEARRGARDASLRARAEAAMAEATGRGTQGPAWSALTRRLAEVEAELARERAEHERLYVPPPPLGEAAAAAASFATVDLDGDGQVSRDEWRAWADAKRAALHAANAERAELTVDNRRMRRVLEVGEGVPAGPDGTAAAMAAAEASIADEAAALAAQRRALAAELDDLRAERLLAEAAPPPPPPDVVQTPRTPEEELAHLQARAAELQRERDAAAKKADEERAELRAAYARGKSEWDEKRLQLRSQLMKLKAEVKKFEHSSVAARARGQ